MKILITGGSGYLGTYLRRFFNADDFSRRSYCDILNPHDATIISDYDAVIHLAAHSDKSPAAAETCFRVNAEGTAHVLRHVRRGAIFIYASTKDVYGMHADRYEEVPETCPTDYCGQAAFEWSKLIGERYVDFYAQARDLRVCIFRLSPVYAPPSEGNQPSFVGNYIERISRNLPIRLPLDGTPRRDPLYVEDFARACRAFIDSNIRRGLYNLGAGVRHAASLREIVELIGRLMGREPLIEPSEATPVPVNYVADIARARAELDWEPIVSLEEGIRRIIG